MSHTGAVSGARRVPSTAALAWSVALVVLAGLAFAVVHHLAGPSEAMAPGMHMSDALFRTSTSALDRPLLGSALFTAWTLDPVALAVLVLIAAAYLTGAALVPVRTGARWPFLPTLAFMAGLIVCGLATNSSIAVYDQVLFTAHMAGHLALVMVAAGPAGDGGKPF